MSQTIQLFKLQGTNQARLMVSWDDCGLDQTVDLGENPNKITVQAPFKNDPDRSITLIINVSPKTTPTEDETEDSE